MSRKIAAKSKANPNPIALPLVEKLRHKDASYFKKVELWGALEFFRVEALLRAPVVIRRVKKVQSRLEKELSIAEEALQLRFEHGIDFIENVLQMGHHRFLQAKWTSLPGALDEENSAVDIQKYFRNSLKVSTKVARELVRMTALDKKLSLTETRKKMREDTKSEILADILGNRRHIFLKIDLAFPPERIIKNIRPFLKSKHNELKNEIGRPFLRRFKLSRKENSPLSTPPITNIKAWLDYFACYDLRTCHGLSYGQIAIKVYRNSHGKYYDRAKVGVKRVTQLIEYATSHRWPPPSRFLNSPKSS